MDLENVLLGNLGGQHLLSLLMGVTEEVRGELGPQSGYDLPHKLFAALVASSSATVGRRRIGEVFHQRRIATHQLVQPVYRELRMARRLVLVHANVWQAQLLALELLLQEAQRALVECWDKEAH